MNYTCSNERITDKGSDLPILNFKIGNTNIGYRLHTYIYFTILCHIASTVENSMQEWGLYLSYGNIFFVEIKKR